MEQQLWDDVLYPSFFSTIRGTLYSTISQDELDEQAFYYARRAISAFKFPKISTQYETFYAIREADGSLIEVDDSESGAIPHGMFKNELTYDEIEIIIAWMKVYWCEELISNADNFTEIYTDSQIKTYSRANMVDKALKMIDNFRDNARRLETNYGRVSASRTPSMGDINSDE